MRFRTRTVHEPNPTVALTRGRITGLLTNADGRCHEEAQPRPAKQHFRPTLVAGPELLFCGLLWAVAAWR